MEGIPSVSFVIAFSAGFLSFVSPCVLPLIPTYLAFITGLSLDELTDGQTHRARGVAVNNSLIFILGFSTVFILFGASASLMGQMLFAYQDIIRRVGGILVVLFGFYMIGFLKLPFLMADKRVHLRQKPAGYLGTFVVGMAFAAGWTPCVGPILGSVLLLASTYDSTSQGIWLLAAYSLGLGLPLLVASMGLNAFLTHSKRLRGHMKSVSLVSGLLLIVVGVLLFTNSFVKLTAWLSRYGIGWYIGQ